MKKVSAILVCLLLVLTVLYPAGVIITGFLGCSFELISVSAFAIAIAVLSVCAIVLDLICRNTIENRAMQILLTMFTPLSLINAVFYILKSPQIEVFASVFVSAICSCYFAVKYGKPLSLKISALVLSVIMIVPIGFISLFAMIFGNFGEDTVVKTVESPSGKYYAQVVDSDHGALGGDTIVEVYHNWELNALLFKIEKKPQRVYFGDWGEYQKMQIYWKDDHCLVINAMEYEIE